jgi:ubiquinone/menaquinone biosynthesis C-methylase UbiE
MKIDFKELLSQYRSKNELLITFTFRESMIRSAIKVLELPSGSTGLDAGCGIGLQALLLSEVIGDNGHVTGLDLSPESLKIAREITSQVGLSSRVFFQKGDVSRLPFEDNSYDWAWSMDCIGYAPMEPLPLIEELKRVTKPGGIIAIAAWSSEHLLSGYPILEAKLQSTSAGISPFTVRKNPNLHFLRALGWLKEAGLENTIVKTFAGNMYAPLKEYERESLIALFKMRWPGIKNELSEQDYADYQRLCLPDSPEFIVNDPDFYAFFTYSMFTSRVPK